MHLMRRGTVGPVLCDLREPGSNGRVTARHPDLYARASASSRAARGAGWHDGHA